MRFEIRIDGCLPEKEPVLSVILFSQNGCEEGIYQVSSTVPEDRKGLLSIIEQSINDCLNENEKDIDEFLSNLVNKHEPKLKEFRDFINQGEVST